MKKAFDRLINKLDTIRDRNSELGEISGRHMKPKK